ncbi:MAG: hypothetical protein OER77_08575 [Myxococcales bacterium]|nr:hypothetical protein [Myxococcales bacterium]
MSIIWEISILDGVGRAFAVLATGRRREAIALFEKHVVALTESSVRFDELQREFDAAGTDFN